MNKLFIIFVAFATLVLSSCSGNIDTMLLLTVDKHSIVADGNDKAVFALTVSGADMLAEAEIVCISDSKVKVVDGTFSTLVPGKYTFVANYQDMTSESVTVEATSPVVPEVQSKFIRKVFVTEFTGQWCSFCPAGYRSLNRILEKWYKDNTYLMALHGGGKDQFIITDVYDDIYSVLGAGYPSIAVDFRESSPIEGGFDNLIGKSLEEYPAHCGVAVASKYDSSRNVAEVTVRIASERTGKYRLSVWVVEDNIIAEQLDGGQLVKDYNHKHVARRLVSKNWRGDRVGLVEAGKEVLQKYDVQIDPEWNLENTTIYAVALDDVDNAVYANNMEICPIVNGNTDFAYKK